MNLGDPTVVDAAARPVLEQLLDQGARFDPEYRGGLSNHLPMALIALYGLGASSKDLMSFYNAYIPRLEVLSASDNQELGRSAGLPDSESTHLGELRDLLARAPQNGFEETRASAIDLLAPGVGAAAFHGLIRTAYGIEASHRAEEFVGLAYWSQRYLPLANELPNPGTLALEPWLRRLVEHVHQHAKPGLPAADLIHLQMALVSRTEGFTQLLDDLDIEHTSTLDFARLAARLYLATGDFTVIHLVTSAHAVGLLSRYAAEPVRLRHWYAVAYLTALVTVEPGAFGELPAVKMLAWPAIRQQAMASMDDHVIKLCYALAELERLDSDPIYQSAASYCVMRAAGSPGQG